MQERDSRESRPASGMRPSEETHVAVDSLSRLFDSPHQLADSSLTPLTDTRCWETCFNCSLIMIWWRDAGGPMGRGEEGGVEREEEGKSSTVLCVLLYCSWGEFQEVVSFALVPHRVGDNLCCADGLVVHVFFVRYTWSLFTLIYDVHICEAVLSSTVPLVTRQQTGRWKGCAVSKIGSSYWLGPLLFSNTIK